MGRKCTSDSKLFEDIKKIVHTTLALIKFKGEMCQLVNYGINVFKCSCVVVILLAEKQVKMLMEGRLYVGGLNLSTTKQDIDREFGKFGSLRDVWLARNPPGFAFIEYFNTSDAE